MRLAGSFKFLGAEKRSGFKDPSQTFYVIGVGQGLDSLRCYVNAEFEYNPVSGKINLVSIS